MGKVFVEVQLHYEFVGDLRFFYVLACLFNKRISNFLKLSFVLFIFYQIVIPFYYYIFHSLVFVLLQRQAQESLLYELYKCQAWFRQALQVSLTQTREQRKPNPTRNTKVQTMTQSRISRSTSFLVFFM